jgi:hypothetical protein
VRGLEKAQEELQHESVSEKVEMRSESSWDDDSRKKIKNHVEKQRQRGALTEQKIRARTHKETEEHDARYAGKRKRGVLKAPIDGGALKSKF